MSRRRRTSRTRRRLSPPRSFPHSKLALCAWVAKEPVKVTRWGPIRQHCKNRHYELASGEETKLSDAIHCC
jgi:hypothetical protein